MCVVALWERVTVVFNLVSRPQVDVPTTLAVIAPLVSVTELPLIFQLAVLRVIAPTFNADRSFVLVCLAVPEKVRVLPSAKAVPPQLAASLQLALVELPPFQVLVAADSEAADQSEISVIAIPALNGLMGKARESFLKPSRDAF